MAEFREMSFNPAEISMIMAVRNYSEGVYRFLDVFFATQKPEYYPSEFIIVDNDSNPPLVIPDRYLERRLNIKLTFCPTPGVSFARNTGVRQAEGKWLLFTDSDCTPAKTFISGYERSINGSIAYAGNVIVAGKGRYVDYYRTQNAFIPAPDPGRGYQPHHIVTGNALVRKDAFEAAGGFEENFPELAGEDMDMGMRLAKIGNLNYAMRSVIYHHMDDGLGSFIRRFLRYGRARKIIEEFRDVPMQPVFGPVLEDNWYNRFIARLQHRCMTHGYNSI